MRYKNKSPSKTGAVNGGTGVLARRRHLILRRLDRLDHDVLTHRTAVFEDNAASNLREKSIVFAATDVQAGLHPRATLPHDDRTAGHYLSAECLEAKPLRVRIAAIS